MGKAAKNIPASVRKRLPRYYAVLQELHAERVAWVSSREISERLGLTPSTVRQDLTHVDFRGTAKKGYHVCCLEGVLAEALGAGQEVRTVIVGAGNLGRALAMHREFDRKGFRICAVFDNDPKVVGKKVGRLTVRHTDEIPAAVPAERAAVAVIAVPAPAAQSVADLLILSGIRGLLNLADVHVIAPRRVSVVEARITASLQELYYSMRTNPHDRPPRPASPRRAAP